MDVSRLRELLKPEAPPLWRALLLLAFTLGLFVVIEGAQFAPADVAVLTGVLLFHEGGHWLGMRLFGYRDVRMFFIPFFGAAVSGSAGGVAPWKKAVVLLLGPLPGIAVALALAIAVRPLPSEPLGRVAVTLAIVNGLNLLPFEPFDGGKLANLVVASRFRVLDVLSLLLGSAGIGALAWKLGSWPLGFVAYLGVVTVPSRVKAIRVARALREGGLPLPEHIEDAPDETLAEVIHQVDGELVPSRVTGPARERSVASWSRDVYERARSAHPGVLASFGLCAAMVVGLGSAAASVVSLHAVRPGEVRPLVRSATSSSGRITAHFSIGFRALPRSDGDALHIERRIDGSTEMVSWTVSDEPGGAAGPRIAAMWNVLSAKHPDWKLVSLGARCHGDGAMLEATTADREPLHRMICLETSADRAVTYEIAGPERLWAADGPILLAIADAVEIAP